MRKDYDLIKEKFSLFIIKWMNRDVSKLEDIFYEDVKGYYSVVHNIQSEQHSIFGVKALINKTPKTDKVEYEICNYVCRLKDNFAMQAAEVPVYASNNNGDYFRYVATFAIAWVKEDEWKIDEIRMDLKDYESPLREYFHESWYFENPIANLTATVHLPCILPDIDSPFIRLTEYEDVLTEEEKIEEQLYNFLYGIDWIMFFYVRDCLADNCETVDKHHYIVERKLKRSPYRYWCSPYSVKKVEINGNAAHVSIDSMMPDCKVREVNFVRNKTWQILNWKED